MKTFSRIVCGIALNWGFNCGWSADSPMRQQPASGVRPGVSSSDYELRVGGAAVEIEADDTMKGYDGRTFQGQDAPLRAVAVVIEKPGAGKLAIVGCDVLNITRDLLDRVVEEISLSCGVPPEHVLINATHTHHAPGTVRMNSAGADPVFLQRLGQAIVSSTQLANERAANGQSRFEFYLGEESTVGQNSRTFLSDGRIAWIGRRDDAVRPTGPIDPELPVLVFRGPYSRVRAVLYNHSCHTIGARRPRARSPGFYGLAAQELEAEVGAPICFLEGASGSTHNVGIMGRVPFEDAVDRIQRVLRDGLQKAAPRAVDRLAAIKRPFSYKIRTFDEAAEEAAVVAYLTARVDNVGEIERHRAAFAESRRALASQQGQTRQTWIQAMLIGDVAIIGVPAEFFTKLGLDIKQRSPFRKTYIAELANDYIGYLPDKDAFKLGGYQTWTSHHSFADEGAGERMVDAVVEMLNELYASQPTSRSVMTPRSD